MNTISKFFHLKENNTSFKTELLAGLTTFVSMSYILFVNPNVLGASGMDKGALFTVTALSAAFTYPRCRASSGGSCRATSVLL